MSDWTGKRVLVTGAASGIGAAAARAFAARGAIVIGLDRQAISAPGIASLGADLTDGQAIERAFRQLGDAPLDVLVNAAGIMRTARLGALTPEHVDAHLAVNLRGLILVTNAAFPLLRPGSTIVNVASELAYLGREEASVYVATKAAVLGLTRSWARELAPHIRVNAVAPGPTDTPLLGFAAMSETERARELALPLQRLGRPEEIAAVILFLAGPEASFVTGHCLAADGGATML
jgi:3-oxoacyl-[acyl-carrier protein] reductase